MRPEQEQNEKKKHIPWSCFDEEWVELGLRIRGRGSWAGKLTADITTQLNLSI